MIARLKAKRAILLGLVGCYIMYQGKNLVKSVLRRWLYGLWGWMYDPSVVHWLLYVPPSPVAKIPCIKYVMNQGWPYVLRGLGEILSRIEYVMN